MNWFDLLMRILICAPFMALIIFGPMLTDYLQRRDEEKAIKEGRLKRLSHAEYNRQFGIKNKLRIVK